MAKINSFGELKNIIGGEKLNGKLTKPKSEINTTEKIPENLDFLGGINLDELEKTIEESALAKEKIEEKINDRINLDSNINRENKEIESIMGPLQDLARENLELSLDYITKNNYLLAKEMGIIDEKAAYSLSRMEDIINQAKQKGIKESTEVKKTEELLNRAYAYLEAKLDEDREKFSQEIQEARKYLLKKFAPLFKKIEKESHKMDEIEQEPGVAQELIKEIIDDFKDGLKEENINVVFKLENINKKTWSEIAVLLGEKNVALDNQEEAEIIKLNKDIKEIKQSINDTWSKKRLGQAKNKIDNLLMQRAAILGKALKREIIGDYSEKSDIQKQINLMRQKLIQFIENNPSVGAVKKISILWGKYLRPLKIKGDDQENERSQVKEFQQVLDNYYAEIKNDLEFKILWKQIENSESNLPTIQERLEKYLEKVMNYKERSGQALIENDILLNLLNWEVKNAIQRRMKAEKSTIRLLNKQSDQETQIVKIILRGKGYPSFGELGAVEIKKEKGGYKIIEVAGKSLMKQLKKGTFYQLNSLPDVLKRKILK